MRCSAAPLLRKHKTKQIKEINKIFCCLKESTARALILGHVVELVYYDRLENDYFNRVVSSNLTVSDILCFFLCLRYARYARAREINFFQQKRNAASKGWYAFFNFN